jgi:hypothetical protein
MRTRRRTRVRVVGIIVGAVCILAAGCSDFDGVGRSYTLTNGTQTTITVVHQSSDGQEVVLIEHMPSGIVGSTYLKPDACDQGIDIARDGDGRELARREQGRCRPWFISDGSPTPFTISNKTSIALTIVYLGPPVIVVANTVLPNVDLTATVQAFGDPSMICFGVLVARNSVGHEVARRTLEGCNDWTWRIQP